MLLAVLFKVEELLVSKEDPVSLALMEKKLIFWKIFRLSSENFTEMFWIGVLISIY